MYRDLLRREGVVGGRRHIGTLVRQMGIEAICPWPNTCHVWAMDISSIPTRHGFVYLAAVNVASRAVPSHLVSIMIEAGFVPTHRKGALKAGQPAHQSRLHARAAGCEGPDHHGRQRRLARQSLAA